MTEKARLGWVIAYVPDVAAAIEFYEKAFGLERAFIAPDASFGELSTGET
jgi:predicted enzyme related to lactoylglutathione lyase